jgi:hypothetical protein
MLATQNVNVTIARDTSIRSGTDRVKHLAMVAALNPVQPGSSISHWDTAGIPNQLMEPSINADLTASVRPPEDLTSSQMTDIGWFSDGDGVPDGKDNCIGSDLLPTVVIGTCKLEGWQRSPGQRLHGRRRRRSVRGRLRQQAAALPRVRGAQDR